MRAVLRRGKWCFVTFGMLVVLSATRVHVFAQPAGTARLDVAGRSYYDASTEMLDLEAEVVSGRLVRLDITAYRGPADEQVSVEEFVQYALARQSWLSEGDGVEPESILQVREALGMILTQAGISWPDRANEVP